MVLDVFSTGRTENLAQWEGDARVEVAEASVADGLFAPLVEVTGRRGPIQRIAHLAAQIAVPQSIQSPFEDVRANYVGTAQILEYARCCAVEKLAFASSSAVYADDAALPTGEDAKLRPQSLTESTLWERSICSTISPTCTASAAPPSGSSTCTDRARIPRAPIPG